MRVGLGLLKWIEPTLLAVTPSDSIKACMAIQQAGGDVRCAAELDMLLFTAFEEVGELLSIQQMRDRLDHATGDEDGSTAQSKAPDGCAEGDNAAPRTGKRKRRTVARVWEADAAQAEAEADTAAA